MVTTPLRINSLSSFNNKHTVKLAFICMMRDSLERHLTKMTQLCRYTYYLIHLKKAFAPSLHMCIFTLTLPLWSGGRLLFWQVFASVACTPPCSAAASPAAPLNQLFSLCQPDFSGVKQTKLKNIVILTHTHPPLVFYISLTKLLKINLMIQCFLLTGSVLSIAWYFTFSEKKKNSPMTNSSPNRSTHEFSRA